MTNAKLESQDRLLEAMFKEILCLTKKNNLDGEEGLMLAVLENAIECFQKIFLPTSERE
jgi:hypothetical protein